MHLSEISFCDKVGFNIKMDEAKQRILDELEQKFNFKVIQKHFDNYTNSIIPRLNNNPHLISVRTNGNPYLLYLTRLNFVNQCVFIDKKIQQGYYFPRMIISKFRFDDTLFDGTLLHGEMVKDAVGNWIFVVCDIIGHNGTYLENINLVKRQNILYDIFANGFVPDEYDVCKFQIKKYFRYGELESVLSEFVPKLPYTCRGLYFKPFFLKFRDVLMNFDDSLIQQVMRKKYKSVSNFLLLEDTETILKCGSQASLGQMEKATAVRPKEKMFYARKTSQPDVYEMFDEQNAQHTACIPTMKVSKMMRELFNLKNVTDKVKIRCEFSDKFQKYIPVCACEN